MLCRHTAGLEMTLYLTPVAELTPKTPIDFSQLLSAGRILVDNVTSVGSTLRKLQISLEIPPHPLTTLERMRLLSIYSDAILRIQGLAWNAASTIACASNAVERKSSDAETAQAFRDALQKLDEHLKVVQAATPTVIHFLQTSTLPRVRRALYARYNVYPHLLHAARLRNLSRRLELWSRFPLLLNGIINALRELPPAMQVIRDFIGKDLDVDIHGRFCQHCQELRHFVLLFIDTMASGALSVRLIDIKII
ncbi:hypothetical protein DFH06DRAFT_1186338 [Mycena polygramma]|nr:hypothetical protein DFH06DRAFT_1186338 [Mycena polygramma]